MHIAAKAKKNAQEQGLENYSHSNVVIEQKIIEILLSSRSFIWLSTLQNDLSAVRCSSEFCFNFFVCAK
jgi:hypothetical protein